MQSRIQEKGVVLMPAYVGTVNVNSLSGVFNIGDVYKIAPTSTSKTFAGGGSFNSGQQVNVRNPKYSVIHIYDPDSDGKSVFAAEDRDFQ